MDVTHEIVTIVMSFRRLCAHLAITLKTRLVINGQLTVVVATLARGLPCKCFEALTRLRSV